MKFFYVHFPKAGGTSLRAQLEKKLPGKIHYDYNHDPIGGVNIRTEAEPPAGSLGVCGHVHANRYARWSELTFTIIREPVQNIISIYFFWKSLPKQGSTVHDRFLDERPNIIDFAKMYPLRELMSQAYFGDFDLKRLDFVGFHEKRLDSFSKLSAVLSIDIDPHYHTNRTDKSFDDIRNSMLENSQLISELRDILKEDVEFYEAMQTEWW